MTGSPASAATGEARRRGDVDEEWGEHPRIVYVGRPPVWLPVCVGLFLGGVLVGLAYLASWWISRGGWPW